VRYSVSGGRGTDVREILVMGPGRDVAELCRARDLLSP
jgi:hypothetical protein